MLSFTESLWMELRDTGLTVFALCPGATDTDFTFVMGTGASVLRSARMRTPEHAVATALRHLERRNPGPSVIDGRSNQLGVIVSRLASRRTSAMMMDRVLDPNRGSKAAAS